MAQRGREAMHPPIYSGMHDDKRDLISDVTEVLEKRGPDAAMALVAQLYPWDQVGSVMDYAADELKKSQAKKAA